jgi:AbrB family looped-hinge helix DNA binding protein
MVELGMVAAFSQKNPLFIHIDKLGRVVIPLAIRKKLNLHPGTTLALHVEPDEEIVLKIVSEEATEPRIVYREGVRLTQHIIHEASRHFKRGLVIAL